MSSPLVAFSNHNTTKEPRRDGVDPLQQAFAIARGVDSIGPPSKLAVSTGLAKPRKVSTMPSIAWTISLGTDQADRHRLFHHVDRGQEQKY
jgi:hypothetical protein